MQLAFAGKRHQMTPGIHAEGFALLHRCLSNLVNECATSNHAGCWHKDYTVNGKTKTYSACQDNIKEYKVSFATSCYTVLLLMHPGAHDSCLLHALHQLDWE